MLAEVGVQDVAVGVVDERIGQGLPTHLKGELPSHWDRGHAVDANSDREGVGQRHDPLLDP